ncbi:MAG: hypothetical protein ACRCW4_14105, partial [Candidatus Neomicrothrix subdominans]
MSADLSAYLAAMRKATPTKSLPLTGGHEIHIRVDLTFAELEEVAASFSDGRPMWDKILTDSDALDAWANDPAAKVAPGDLG